jgi:NADH-quinone oxidoreductase subunit N
MNWHAVLVALAPENLLLAGIVLLLVFEIASRRTRDGFWLALLAVLAAAAAALMLFVDGYAAAPFPGHFSVAPTTSLPKAVMIALALPVLLLSREDFRETRYYVLLLASLYGACLLVSADSFLTLFLGLEIMSLPVYVLVLAAFQRPQCAEASLKYLVLGGAATATLLTLSAFGTGLSSTDPLAVSGTALVVLALMLKAAVVPFHAWAPDAYEGASVPVTAYMATVVKAAVLLAALRLFGSEPLSRPLLDLLVVLPLVSMVWGNLAAMRQASFRRMIAYSSIAHAGYLFFAFLGAGPGRHEAIVFYLVVYGVLNMLAFAALPRATDDVQGDRLDALKGLFHRQPVAALLIAIAMLSLAGLPPLPGFTAKFLVFKNVLAAGFTLYAVLGLVASYLGIYFYLRVIQYMFMDADADPALHGRPRQLAFAAAGLCLLPTLALTLYPGGLLGWL